MFDALLTLIMSMWHVVLFENTTAYLKFNNFYISIINLDLRETVLPAFQITERVL